MSTIADRFERLEWFLSLWAGWNKRNNHAFSVAIQWRKNTVILLLAFFFYRLQSFRAGPPTYPSVFDCVAIPWLVPHGRVLAFTKKGASIPPWMSRRRLQEQTNSCSSFLPAWRCTLLCAIPQLSDADELRFFLLRTKHPGTTLDRLPFSMPFVAPSPRSGVIMVCAGKRVVATPETAESHTRGGNFAPDGASSAEKLQ